MAKNNRRRPAALLSLLLAFALAGCEVLGVSPVSSHPEVTAAPSHVAAPAATQYEGWSLRVHPALGPEALLTDGFAVQQVLAAAGDESLTVADAGDTRFKSRIELIDPDGKTQHTYAVNSEGLLLLRTSKGRVFRMPEYVYYLIESQLWAYAGTLKDSVLLWDPAVGADAMETDLDRLIKTALLPGWGYADTYFQTYEVLGVDTETRDTAKVYLMLSYAGYSVQGKQFDQQFQCTAPARLVFTKLGNNRWQLVDFRQADPNADSQQVLYDNLRKVLPYEYMEDVMAEMEDTTALTDEIHRQVTDYLRDRGLSDLEIGD